VTVKKYFMIDILSSFDILPHTQNAERYPFTDASADRFFASFMSESFMFDGDVNFMLIYSAKENLPRPSFAHGWLFQQPEDKLKAEWNAIGRIPDRIGDIEFECGELHGEPLKPKIRVRRADGSWRWANYTEEQVSSSTSSPSTTSSGNLSPGCLIGIVVIVLFVVIWFVATMSGNHVAPPQQSTSSQGKTVGTMRGVIAIQLNMRSGSGTQYPVVRVFKQNERIVTIGEPQTVNGEQWIQASTPDGQTRGWVNRKLLNP
jgi:hypothetical protein